jgi:hypothetical protein
MDTVLLLPTGAATSVRPHRYDSEHCAQIHRIRRAREAQIARIDRYVSTALRGDRLDVEAQSTDQHSDVSQPIDLRRVDEQEQGDSWIGWLRARERLPRVAGQDKESQQ